MTFRLRVLDLDFRAGGPIRFPPGKAGNVVRGSLGLALREVAGGALYQRIFAPSGSGSGPSGFVDPPRPFVLRVNHLDGASIGLGLPFRFRVHLFDLDVTLVPVFVETFRAMARAGLGPGRGRAELAGHADRLVELPLASRPARRLRVAFLSPTELKAEGGLAARPDFPVLFARARDRVATLRALYGPGPPDLDFNGIAERAKSVRMTRCQVAHESIERRSSRTGRTHPLGGFTGEAEYEGDLSEFVPYLEAAEWTGVGRQTVWGKGAIAVTVLPAGISG